ncbi:SDR family NAD(P)-dependent oxidoreductase [Bradyrhizobium mercantei]|uniref:SDR family NAD(P)-dependent oxidoreductase n=1 Tax=Bradyrhizobium mercantei TaxID=1904807 RepID=UPI000976127C|nr:SDR family NAD(P)-dependent oxidoreductase [Bradyrhizobium mercantei]
MKIHDLFDVGGRSIVVTGGASGIGLAIARALAENGARVTIADVNSNALEKALPLLGDDAAAERLDVVDRGAVERVFDAIDHHRNGIDVVFVNAGIGGGPGFAAPNGERGVNHEGTIDGSADAEWNDVIAINLTGARNTCAAAARVMKARGKGGRIIATSSAAAILNAPFVSTAYHASKAGMAHMIRQLAIELAPHNILVNAIAPANFVTNIGDGAMQNPAVKALFARNSLLGRVAETEEICGVALFLASAASSYITGTQVRVDGGACLIGPS